MKTERRFGHLTPDLDDIALTPLGAGQRALAQAAPAGPVTVVTGTICSGIVVAESARRTAIGGEHEPGADPRQSLRELAANWPKNRFQFAVAAAKCPKAA